MATLHFNAEEVEPSSGFEALPAGTYTAVIADSELKETRSGNGRYLQFEFVITEGEHVNRKLWARLNIENPNPDAVRFARADLSAICRAVHVLHPKDTCELHNLPLVLTVKCRKTPDGELVNDIRGYAPKPVAAAPAAPREKPAWMR